MPRIDLRLPDNPMFHFLSVCVYSYPAYYRSPMISFTVFRKSYFNFYKSHQEFFIIIHLHTHSGRKNKPKAPKIFQTSLLAAKPALRRLESPQFARPPLHRNGRANFSPFLAEFHVKLGLENISLRSPFRTRF